MGWRLVGEIASEMVLDLQDPREVQNVLESRCFSGFWVSMVEGERDLFFPPNGGDI